MGCPCFEVDVEPCDSVHVFHVVGGSFVAALAGQHGYAIHMNCVSTAVHRPLYGDMVGHVVLQGVGIVHVQRFVAFIGYQNHLLTGSDALVAAACVIGIGAFRGAL